MYISIFFVDCFPPPILICWWILTRVNVLVYGGGGGGGYSHKTVPWSVHFVKPLERGAIYDAGGGGVKRDLELDLLRSKKTY
jgi:hypothetical protein